MHHLLFCSHRKTLLSSPFPSYPERRLIWLISLSRTNADTENYFFSSWQRSHNVHSVRLALNKFNWINDYLRYLPKKGIKIFSVNCSIWELEICIVRLSRLADVMITTKQDKMILWSEQNEPWTLHKNKQN